MCSEGLALNKVLIVEDNVNFRNVLAETLTGVLPSLEIVIASTGQEALEKVGAMNPSFVLLDIRLPDTMGLGLISKIKALSPSTHIAVLTSYDIPEYRQKAAEYGIVCFMVKGQITVEDIVTVVKNYSKC